MQVYRHLNVLLISVILLPQVCNILSVMTEGRERATGEGGEEWNYC